MGGLSSLIVFFENALYPFRVLNNYMGRFFGRILGKRAVKLTLAGKISIAFFVCFAIFITVIWIVSAFEPSKYRLNTFTDWMIIDFPIYYLLALLISIGVYWGVRLATREKPTLYPEIDQCWAAFEKWREKQNLDWHEFKRFLVLGPTLEVSKAMHAEMKDRKVGAVPGGAADWMHWFGTNESLYLHLKRVCHTSQRLESLTGPGGKSASFSPANTLQASIGVPEWSASVGIHDMTAEVGSFGDSMDDMGASLDPAQSLDPYGSDELAPMAVDSGTSDNDSDSEDEVGEDGDSPSERVHYLAKMMQTRTGGEVPFHGVVITIPFDKFIAKENFKTISAAIKRDLLELRKIGEVAFPVSFVFTSMEKDQGFPKLQNLLGTQRSASGRFGAGCRVEDIPVIDKSNLAIQVERACQSFEDWVINRWGKSSQLARAAQNKELYKMIVRIRQQFRPRFDHLLESSLIWKPSESPDEDGVDLTLSGCYFVSTGDHASDRGFLNGVFLKCDEFAETSSWADTILNRDRYYSVMATLLFLLSVITVIAVGFFIYYGA